MLVKPDKLRQYFDNPSWSATSMAQVSPKLSIHKWDGVPVDMRPFSRFNVSPQVTDFQDDDLRGVVLGEIDRMNRPLQFTSEEQSIVDAAAQTLRPECNEKQLPVLEKDEYFSHYRTFPAQVKYTAVPKSIGLSEGVMMPQERRERLEFEVKNFQAQKVERKAAQDREHRIEYIKKNYPCGVLGVDGPMNPNTVIYRDTADRIVKKTQEKANSSSKRAEYLQQMSSSSHRLKYSILEHDGSWKGDSRARTSIGRSRNVNTHSRLFTSDHLSWNPRRAQHLRNSEQAGRPYNIVNGCKIDYIPPTVAESHIPRQAHPSISIHGYMKR